MKPYRFHWRAIPEDAPQAQECLVCGRAIPIQNVILEWEWGETGEKPASSS